MTDDQTPASENIHKRSPSPACAEVAASAAEDAQEGAQGAEVETAENALPSAPDPLLAALVEKWPDIGWAFPRGERVVFLPPHLLQEVAEQLRLDGFEMCVDLAGADYLDYWDRDMGSWQGEPTRYEVVVNLVNMKTPGRIRLRVPIEEEDAVCPTLAFIWPSADPHEREVFDLYGIRFDGHPDLTRILMPDDWEGHPLRKDYGHGSIPVSFKEGNSAVGVAPPAPAPVTFKGLGSKAQSVHSRPVEPQKEGS